MKLWTRCRAWTGFVAMTVTLAVGGGACGGSQPAGSPSAAKLSPPGASGGGTAATKGTDAWKPAIRTAAVPADPCTWIPVAEVEEIVGKLAEPPRKADGCRYTLVMPEAVVAKRAQAKAMQQKINQAFGNAVDPALRGSIAEAQDDPHSYAITVKVDVNGGAERELAASAISKQFGFADGAAGDTKTPDGQKGVADWDDAGPFPYGFSGRVGHVRVTVAGESPDVPREPMQALAARVRDRIPDLPFPVTNPYQVMQMRVQDPCSLLTRAEAEAVLGPLAIAPYRSSSYWPPLAHGEGDACAYFTPGHHVFVLSPTWERGGESFKLEKGIGGLVGIVAPQELVVLKGPWDQAQISGTTGALLFLKGDRLLEVYYRTSRATRGDAVKLAAAAMQRLAP